ncbi:hypothetical protein Nmel_007951 [Mimus melanotis]
MDKCKLLMGRMNFIYLYFEMGYRMEKGVGSVSLEVECIYIQRFSLNPLSSFKTRIYSDS